MTAISLVTNASVADDLRIRSTVPSWLRVFGERLREVVIIVDQSAPTGRIARLHGTLGSSASLAEAIADLEAGDRRVRHQFFPGAEPPQATARRWFRRGVPLRCQAGTPILAFARAFDSAAENLVLRADCDMLFVEAGWLDAATKLLRSGAADLVEPPRLGQPERSKTVEISTRALMIDRQAFDARCLPLPAHRLDVLRRLHRRLSGRPTWVALEQMFQREKQRGHLRHVVLENSLGYSMHVATRDDVRVEGFAEIVAQFEHRAMPAAQNGRWNFLPAAWVGAKS